MGINRKELVVGFFTICLAGIVSLTGCSLPKKEEGKEIKIGVTVYNQYDTFVSQLMEKFNTYASEKEAETGVAISVETYNASDSQSTQNGQVEDMIEDGCDVICVNLVDRTEPTTIIDMAENHNIPVIFFNRELVEKDLERWDRLYYVGASAFESGTLEGEIAAEIFKENPSADRNDDGIFQYTVLEGETGHQDAIVRTEYSVVGMTENGVKVEKIGYAIANWNRAQAQTKMKQMIEEHGYEIELVLSNNDDMALGAIDAYKEMEIPQNQWPVIVGVDGTNEGLEAVEKGEMAGTVYNDKEGQARKMLELAYALSIGEDLEKLNMEDGKYIRLPYAKVLQKDVENYIQ